MTKYIAKTYVESKDIRGYVTYALIGISAMLFFVYAMNVYTTVSRTVAMQRMNMEATVLASAVYELDSKYSALSDSLKPELLDEYGMVQGKVSAYIPRSSKIGSIVSSGYEL